MSKQIKTKTIHISDKEGTFSVLFKKKKDKNSELSNLRQILSNEKAKILNICKTKQPESLYKLAKLIGRDFKAVRHDVKILERYGFIELISSYKKGRERLRPIVDIDQLVITINI